jgi:hypothetical protein
MLRKRSFRMRKFNITKRVSAAAAAVFAGVMLASGVASAIQYNGDQTIASPNPAFNVFTGNMPAPAPAGSEANFYRGRAPINNNEAEGTTQYSDPVNTECVNDKLVQMNVYIHNGASQSGNNNGSGPSVAKGTRVKVTLPNPSNAASNFTSDATISADNAATVTDGLTINCSNGKKVKLQFQSATSFSTRSGVVNLGSDVADSDGALVRSANVPGEVWGCWDDRVYVVVTVKMVEEATPPPPPEVTATCDLLKITATENRRARISEFKYTAKTSSQASTLNVKNVVINWGDNNTVTKTNPSDVVGLTHEYAKDGEYRVSAIVTFSLNDKPDIVAGGPDTVCAVTVIFKPGETPVVTTVTPQPPRPTTLVNTGAGSIAAIFALTTIAGTVAHRYLTARRLGAEL